LNREFIEETGFIVNIVNNIGTYDFLVKTNHKDTTHTHHICIFYEVTVGGRQSAAEIAEEVITSKGGERNDSLGIKWVPINDLNEGNTSPLVRKAVKWLGNKITGCDLERFDDWETY